jgi:hypothetical protein
MSSNATVKKHRDRFGALTRFYREEDGVVTIPSLIWIVFLFFFLLATIEMSMAFIKMTLLEQRVAITSRVMQLGLDGKPDEETLKKTICGNLAFLHDCMDNLTAETCSIDASDWSSTIAGTTVNCDVSKDSTDKTVENGSDDQMMLMRVCLRVDPILPALPFTKALVANGKWGDQYALVTTTAFVNEPRIGD